MVLAVTLVFSFLFVSVSAQAFCTPGTNLHVLSSTSAISPSSDRNYLVYVPSGGAAVKPVVYVFHGSAINSAQAANWLATADFTAFADQADVIMVAPEAQETPYSGSKLNWYAGDQIGDTTHTLHHDDGEFIGDLIAEVDSQACTDDQRYALGYSAGAAFTMQLACF